MLSIVLQFEMVYDVLVCSVGSPVGCLISVVLSLSCSQLVRFSPVSCNLYLPVILQLYCHLSPQFILKMNMKMLFAPLFWCLFVCQPIADPKLLEIVHLSFIIVIWIALKCRWSVWLWIRARPSSDQRACVRLAFGLVSLLFLVLFFSLVISCQYRAV